MIRFWRQWRSLKSRVSFFTLVIFVAGIWSLALYASKILRDDIEKLLGDQQFSMVSYIAGEINDELEDRFSGLTKVAAGITPAMMSNASFLPAYLEQQPLLLNLFNGGVVAYRPDGQAIAEYTSLRRASASDADREAMIAVFKRGEPTIGRPAIDKKLQAPAFSMAVLVRDAHGAVIGALAGITNLGERNFLDKVAGSRNGKTGGYLIVASDHRLIVTATDKSRVLEIIPEPGVSLANDRFHRGYEGSAVAIDTYGVEVLTSAKSLPLAGWYVVANLSTTEAFEPIRDMQQLLMLSTLLLTLVAAGLTWWMLKRQFSPMLDAVDLLTSMSGGNAPLSALPVTRRDEIGELLTSFNRLLETLFQREQSLHESEAFKNIILNSLAAEIAVLDRNGIILAVNERWRRFASDNGAKHSVPSLSVHVGTNYIKACGLGVDALSDEASSAQNGIQAVLDGRLASFSLEYPCHSWLEQRWFNMIVVPLGTDDDHGVVIAHTNITAQKRVEQNELFRSRVLELQAEGAPLPSILEAIVLGVEGLKPAMLCSILLLDREGKRLGIGAAPSLPGVYSETIEALEIGMGIGSCGTAAFTGERVIVEDIRTHPYWMSFKDIAEKAGLRSCWSQPIFSSSGPVLGTFAIYQREVHSPDQSDIEIIEQSARLASIAIERNFAVVDLRNSEEGFRNLFEKNSSVMWLVDLESGRIIEANKAAAVFYGYSREQLMAMSVEEINVLPRERIVEIRQQILLEECNFFHFQHRLSSGELRDVEVHSTPIKSAGRTLAFSIIHDVTQRRQAEAELRIAAVAFNSQEAMMVTDARSVILRVNQAFTDITGYTAEDSVGRTPHLLQSGRHPPDFYREMWDIVRRTGAWQGEVWDRRKNGQEYPKWLSISAVKGDDGAVTNYVGTHHDITERKMAESKIDELAFFDPLTHLPNRTLLLDRLKQVMTSCNRNATFGAVLFIDLDHFKTLNDLQGHHKGDLLLLQVALRITASIREGDTVARFGGDEFVVVLGNLKGYAAEAATQTEVVGEKILEAIGQMYQLGSISYRCTASIGATLFYGRHTPIDDVLKQADLAMYKSKETGRNALRFFDPAMQTVVMERAAMESDLRQAILVGQFALYYQAQVDAEGRVTGSEALVRWLHPERGMVSPADFIPVAEATGLILGLGHWVLVAACLQLASWGIRQEMAHLSLAVNVSARQFCDPAFVNKVLAVLEDTGANPHRLKLELTESVLADNIEDIIEKMSALKAVGVGFSLDDFGTGYSSLSYLKRLPLDQLKIDQSFVRDVLLDPNDAVIAKTIVALALSLGFGVIAEGVETEAQRAFLAAFGCHACQGYLFSRPLPVEGFERIALRGFQYPMQN